MPLEQPINLQHSRRLFLQGLALAGTGVLAAPLNVFASDSSQWQLPERTGKATLPLHYNENSLGMSPKALKAGQVALNKYGNRYPDTLALTLRESLASQNKIEPTQLLFGNGSTELLGAAVALAANQSRSGEKATIVEPSPTFGGLKSYARTYGLKVESVPVGSGFVTDIQALRDKTESIKGPVLVNICNPNNPTGTIVNSDDLNKWMIEAPDSVMFLVDEAYYEYAAPDEDYQSALPLVLQGKENLLVTRTFSKIYGMAGMRIGYGFAARQTAKNLKGFSADWNLNVAGIAAAVTSLEDESFFNHSLDSNSKGKQILLDTLSELELPYIPGYTNFVLHKINSEVNHYSARMLANNIKVGRRMTKDDSWNRLSIGTPEQMMEFRKTLKTFRENGWV